MHVDVDKMGTCAAIGLPVGFGVFVSELVGSMVIRGHLQLLPAFVLLEFHTGPWRLSSWSDDARTVYRTSDY